MEEFNIIQSMLNILNSDSQKKKYIIEALPILLDNFDIHGEFGVYNMIVTSTQNLCFQIFNFQLENSALGNLNISLDNLKSLFIYFVDIIKKHNVTDIVQLLQYCLILSNKIEFNYCSNEKLRNIGFCIKQLYTLCNTEVDDDKHLNNLRNILTDLLNRPQLKKSKLDVVIVFLSSIVSIQYIPKLWHNIKHLIKVHPDRVISVLFNMQCLFFDSLFIGVILNDEEFWNLLCNLLTSENNTIRMYNNVILKISCSQLSNENVNFCENKKQSVKLWNDYSFVMETLENTQQHLTLPILNIAKKLSLNETNDEYNLPLKWIIAMYYKMTKHSSKYVILASVDIITNLPAVKLKSNEQLLQLFMDSLNNVFLYKMTNEICVTQPQLEIILSLWFDKLMMSKDGHEVFRIFLSCIPNVRWSIVPLTFLIKSLINISSNPSLEFNIINYILKIKSVVEKMPNSYLKTVILSFLFILASKFFVDINTKFCCDLFDCIQLNNTNTNSWNYIINLTRKLNNFNDLDKEIAQLINKKHAIYSTSIGLFVLSNVSNDRPISIIKLEDIFYTVDVLDKLNFINCLLEVENYYGRRNIYVSQVLDKHIWEITILCVEKCLETNEDIFFSDSNISSFLNKVLSSNRVMNTTRTMHNWFIRCIHIMEQFSKINYNILTIFCWIGKYAIRFPSEYELKNDWLTFTKQFIDSGFFSNTNVIGYNSRKPGVFKIPLLGIINTFFQYSTISKEKMLDIFDWLTKRTVEYHDNYWRKYFLTIKTFLCKFPIEIFLEKIISFVKNYWEFLVDCRISCFPNAIKSFIEMAFYNNLLLEENYIKFIKNQIILNLLTKKYRDKFNVYFSLLLLKHIEKNQIIFTNNTELHEMLPEFFTKCILFSIERYGAIKIEWDTHEYIRALNDFSLIDDISTEYLPDDKYLRFKAIECLYKLSSNTLWKNVLNKIIKTESSLPDRKFFHNSKAHRIKQRVVQILLIIACDKSDWSLIFEENIYKWLLRSLKEVSHIHSVAYQLIWLLVLVYNKCHIFTDFWNDFKNAQENQNYLCSFISIIYLLHKLKVSKQFKNETKNHLLPLCFSNGYKIRFYAQITIAKLFSNEPEESEEWLLLGQTIDNIIAKNELIKRYENPFNDFFYQELNIINSLSMKNICIEVPRLLNIVHEERFPIKWLNDFSINIDFNNKYDLSHCAVSTFIEKNTTSATLNEISIFDTVQNTQRKYVPLQPMDEYTTSSKLIVIASLIDKVTNLGGLARTCQVFGASIFCVDNLSCIDKREFTALSMTAEKHQCIIEVKVKNLKSYLQKKKNEGYQIVAAEQTINSVKLHSFKLPFKCVLLLGNETSGIPHDLLSIMDTCVEIEQLGIVRSLNVHVAGSLFIWEYTKQHCLKYAN